MESQTSRCDLNEPNEENSGTTKTPAAGWGNTEEAQDPGNDSDFKRGATRPINSRIQAVFYFFFSPSPSKCMGLTSISEDSSEISFLLVENYNYDHSLWSSDRMGIFGPKSVLERLSFHCCTFFMDGREEEIHVFKSRIGSTPVQNVLGERVRAESSVVNASEGSPQIQKNRLTFQQHH